MNLALRDPARAVVAPAPIACAILLTLGILSGCGEDAADPTAPDVVGGGQERVLDFDTFRAEVAPVLHARGCSATGDCHGGGLRGSFELSPASAPDDDFDFRQAVEQIDDLDPAASSLLTKPLAPEAGGAPHAFVAFTSTDDGDYQTILDWIEAGELRP